MTILNWFHLVLYILLANSQHDNWFGSLMYAYYEDTYLEKEGWWWIISFFHRSIVTSILESTIGIGFRAIKLQLIGWFGFRLGSAQREGLGSCSSADELAWIELVKWKRPCSSVLAKVWKTVLIGQRNIALEVSINKSNKSALFWNLDILMHVMGWHAIQEQIKCLSSSGNMLAVSKLILMFWDSFTLETKPSSAPSELLFWFSRLLAGCLTISTAILF